MHPAQDPQRFKAFVSCGTAYTEPQRAFVSAVETYLHAKGCDNHTVGRHNFSCIQPFKFARDVIGECDCAVIIAFERLRVAQGTEKPDSGDASSIDGQRHPTVWNQIEGAMAYAHDLPMLVLTEAGLHRQGVLSKRFEWNAVEVAIDQRVTDGQAFRDAVDDWLSRVRAHREARSRRKLDLDRYSIGEIVSSLKPSQLWSLIAAALVVFSAIAAAAYHIGQSAS